MCGIYGSTKYYTPETVSKKLNRIAFRGPDFSDYKYYNEKIVLGHNRLSIIDLDARSNQPLEYKHLVITFNGEIYNFQSIKTALEKQGFAFRTSSDTEMICAAYLAYGEDCVQHFNGMFAFVIFDKNKNCFFGAKDRLGQKPFYYTLAENEFEFCSQISPIALGNNFMVDEKSVAQFLKWQYVPDPNSIYKEVKKLRAGYSFSYDINTAKFSEAPYWNLPEKTDSFSGNFTEAKTKLNTLLQDAVGQRMISDVPLGVFLSGGIDSSLVAALAQQKSVTPVKTFAVKFDEKGFDESSYANQVAQHLKTNHTTIPCNYEEGIDLIENLWRYFDEPFGDASAIPTALLSKHTRKFVTVALSGDGGDESFFGYERYKWMLQVAPLFRTPDFLRKNGAKLLEILPNYKLKQIAAGLKVDNLETLYMKLMANGQDHWMMNPALGNTSEYQEYLHGSDVLLNRISAYDLKTYLNGDINTKVDRASMAFSLEVRAPLMDYRVVEFARSLPTSFKYDHKGVKKKILKSLLFDRFPKTLFDRPKSGFGMPLNSWFRTRLKDYVQDTLSANALENIPNLNMPVVNKMIQEHMNGTANRSVLIWNLIVMANWQKNQTTLQKASRHQNGV